MRKRYIVLALVCVAIGAMAGYWYYQFTKHVEAMTTITLPTFESGFKSTPKE